MGQSCDVGPYRATRRPSSADAAAGATTITLARAPAVALKIRGVLRAPNVSITGPGGRRILADSAGQLARNKYYYLENPRDDTTSVVIADPAPGVWTIRTLAGSSPVAGVSQASVNPDPNASGRVIGSGSARALEYVDETAGLTVTFWERGLNYEQNLGSAQGTPCLQGAKIQGRRPANAFMAHPQIRCGVIPFAPAPGPAGVRNIVAVVTDHGEPVTEFKVTSYRTAGEGTPARPRNLKITRRGRTVQITWNPSAGAYDYDVDVTLSDGAKLLDVMGNRARYVLLHGVSRRLAVSVVVRGLRADDVQGPAARASSTGR